MTKNPQYHGRSKHIDIKFHFVREKIASNIIGLKYCKSENMVADILTKGLGRTKFEELRDRIGMKLLPEFE